jgi:hypothetical protein
VSDRQDPPRRDGHGPVAAASVTSATTGFVVWLVNRAFFPGGMPPEVYGFLLTSVPAAMGFLGAEAVYWRQKRRQT